MIVLGIAVALITIACIATPATLITGSSAIAVTQAAVTANIAAAATTSVVMLAAGIGTMWLKGRDKGFYKSLNEIKGMVEPKAEL